MPGIDSNTKLIINGNSDYTDASDNGHTPTVNGATISTGIKKYGAGSGLFAAASSQYVSYPSHTDFDFRTYTQSWTIEMWIYDTDTSDDHMILSIGTANFETMMMGFQSGNPLIQGSDDGIGWWAVKAGSVSSNVWTHLAAVNNAGTVDLYVGGSSVGSLVLTADNHFANGYIIKLGAHYDFAAGWYYNGYLDEVRISDIARWTTNFTPSTEEYSAGGSGIIIPRRRTEGE